eukprot:Gb_25032 [translate_table: standard]
MMAFGLSLTRVCGLLHQKLSICGHSSMSVNVRHKSGSSRKGKRVLPPLIEVELESGNGFQYFSVKRLEEAIHGIIVRRAAPDWLPFLPGSSYWVPPPANSGRIVDLVARLSNPMTAEEMLSFTTARGWPSSAYFIEDASAHTVEPALQQKEKSEEEES